ncbi:MAG: calcium-binding protein [Alphaproteobacteria bacterium]|nr:calcium-binding protein [Alphaproteobacteria bacterium]
MADDRRQATEAETDVTEIDQLLVRQSDGPSDLEDPIGGGSEASDATPVSDESLPNLHFGLHIGNAFDIPFGTATVLDEDGDRDRRGPHQEVGEDAQDPGDSPSLLGTSSEIPDPIGVAPAPIVSEGGIDGITTDVSQLLIAQPGYADPGSIGPLFVEPDIVELLGLAQPADGVTSAAIGDETDGGNTGGDAGGDDGQNTGGNTLRGGSGDDILTGGREDDRIYGRSGNDRLLGADGDDSLFGGSGDDRLEGDDGHDHLIGGRGEDRLYGHRGDDLLAGGRDDDRLQGGAGDDTLIGGAGRDELDGGAGNDLFEIRGREGQYDRFTGGAGSDSIVNVGNGDVTLHGFRDNAGIEVFDAAGRGIRGDNDDNHLDFRNTRLDNVDYVYGGRGDDRIEGSDLSDDTLRGGRGEDRLYGHRGDDLLAGGRDDDRLQGGSGDDTLIGGAGDDRLEGDSGDDIMMGGAGQDLAYGDAGNDLFVFTRGDGDDRFIGGNGWTDSVEVQGGDGQFQGGWTIDFNRGGIESQDGDSAMLSDDSAGTITLSDGSELTFEGVEAIQW